MQMATIRSALRTPSPRGVAAYARYRICTPCRHLHSSSAEMTRINRVANGNNDLKRRVAFTVRSSYNRLISSAQASSKLPQRSFIVYVHTGTSFHDRSCSYRGAVTKPAAIVGAKLYSYPISCSIRHLLSACDHHGRRCLAQIAHVCAMFRISLAQLHRTIERLRSRLLGGRTV